MPPNLGGFFMVRSYYPSECHADYFDFERIEALKPAIEACGISTLSQSPMIGFHKQMDNRIKLLEEILSFCFSSRRRHTRVQGDWSSDVCSSDLDAPSSLRFIMLSTAASEVTRSNASRAIPLSRSSATRHTSTFSFTLANATPPVALIAGLRS